MNNPDQPTDTRGADSVQRPCCAAGVESEMCSQCGGQGWYMNGPTEDPYQQQCELCYGTGWLEKAKPQHNAAGELRLLDSDERKETK